MLFGLEGACGGKAVKRVNECSDAATRRKRILQQYRRWARQSKNECSGDDSENLDDLGCCWRISLAPGRTRLSTSACRRRKRGPHITRFTCQNNVQAARPLYIDGLAPMNEG